MQCDQCQLARIQGLVCHETGCPNSGKTWDADREAWIKYVECFECGFDVEQGTHCDCQDFEDSNLDESEDSEDLELDEPESEDFDANADRITDFE